MAKTTKKADTLPAPAEPTTALALVGNQTGLVNYTEPDKPFIPIKWVPQAEGVEIDSTIAITLAKLIIVNGGSPAMKKETRVPGAEVGMFLNTDSLEVSETIEAVFLYPFISRYFSFPKMTRPPTCMSVDGNGKYGICPSGQYDQFKIPTAMVERGGIKQEVGVCAQCPLSQRAFGGASECQELLQMICTKASIIRDWAQYVKRMQAGDLSVGNDLLNSLFIITFKSTSMTLGRQLLERIIKDGSAFKWEWTLGTAFTSNTQGEWYNPTAARTRQLDADETIFARSLYRFAKGMKPIITDVSEVEDEGTKLDTNITLE